MNDFRWGKCMNSFLQKILLEHKETRQYYLENEKNTSKLIDQTEHDLREKSYQTKLIVFIDIQNFSEIVPNKNIADYILARMYTLKEVLTQNTGVQVTVMSDSIVITQPYEGVNDYLTTLFMSLNSFCFELLRAERVTFVRGYVSVGEVCHEADVVYGEGIVKAVREEKGKVLFGIWLSEKIALDIEEVCGNHIEKIRWGRLLYKTTKGTRLDYLSDCFAVLRTYNRDDEAYFGQQGQYEFGMIIGKLFAEISEINKKGKDVQYLKKKYCDFAHYFNRSLTKLWIFYSHIYGRKEVKLLQLAKIDEKNFASRFIKTDKL